MNSIKRLMILVVMVFSLVMLSSFVFTVDSRAIEIAQQYPPPPQPPPLRMEQPPVAPAPVDVWSPGHWDWNGHEYTWVPGQWVKPPQTNALWVPSHWEWNGHDWAWIAGHWQQ
jgi:hypothetical protein